MATKTRAKQGARKAATGFTADEKAAARARIQELKAQAGAAEGERAVRESLAKMPPAERAMGERLHAIIKAAAPSLSAKTWYGMPAYAKGEDVVCFFKHAGKFKARYSTLGFSDEAKLDEGHMWATEFALTELAAADEARIAALVKRAVG